VSILEGGSCPKALVEKAAVAAARNATFMDLISSIPPNLADGEGYHIAYTSKRIPVTPYKI
jgi:hypothetical protein